jgi:RNA polymerase sigma factor (sigma-70 family)
LAAVPSIGRASLVEAPRVAPQAAATEGLYERHADKIQSYCHHQLGSREEAEDAVQTTFMNAFRALGRGVVPEAESAWLFKIAENVCLSRRRSSWRRGKIESPSDFNVIEEIVPGPSRQRDELIGIEDALASMPEQQRRAILLREWQGLSYREIASELEVSQSAVETLIFRARRSLAQGLEQPDSIKPKRKSFRRALHMIDLGTIAAAAKTLLAGSAAVKATAAAVAVTAAVGTAVTVAPHRDARLPATTLAASAPASSSTSATSSNSSVSFVASTAGTVGAVSEPRRLTTPLASKQKPGRAEVSRSAPAGGVTDAPATPLAAEPQAPVAEPVEPVQTESAQPTAAEPTPAPAAEPTKRTDAGKQDEGKQDEGRHKGKGAVVAPAPAVEPVATAPVVSTPRERRGGNSKPRDDEKGKGAPVNQAPAPASLTIAAPAAVEEATKVDAKKGQGRGKDKQRELTVAQTSTPVPTPVVTTDPVAETPAAPATEPAPVAESNDNGSSDKGSGDGNGKRKGRDK